MDVTKIDSILSGFPETESSVIAILHEMQNEYRYLPEEELGYVSKKLRIPLTQIYSIATFYNRFSLTPKGKYVINICLGTACHVLGAGRLLDRIKSKLHIEDGETTDDLKFTLESVRCIGACGLAPAVVINEETHAKLTPKKIDGVLNQCE